MGSVPILKVVIAGDPNVGKTSLVRAYCEGKFETSRVLTIGVDFQTKLVNLPAGTVKLSIWDMAGQDRFEVVRAGFYRGSLTSALVYNLEEPETLKSLVRWYHEVRRTLPQQKFIVVGNKLDLVPIQINPLYVLQARVREQTLEVFLHSLDTRHQCRQRK